MNKGTIYLKKQLRKICEVGHNFDLLRGYQGWLTEEQIQLTEDKKWPNRINIKDLLTDLWFSSFDNFFMWLVKEFARGREKIWCGACCRSLLHEFVYRWERYTYSWLKFTDYIHKVRANLSQEEQRNIVDQVEYYFKKPASIQRGIHGHIYDFLEQNKHYLE